MSFTYKITLDPKKDAWNWLDACNDSTQHGVDWSKNIPDHLLASVKGKPEIDAFEIIVQFLKHKYIDDSKQISDFTKFINKQYDENFEKACQLLEKVMNRPLYRNNFKIYITTLPMATYNYDEGSLFDYIGWTDPIAGFLHELSHMQFMHYWRNDHISNVSKLTNNQFEWLKESLTVIFDEDFLPLTEKVDNGYETHKPFRKKLHEYWITNHDFDKLVDFGIKILPDFIN